MRLNFCLRNGGHFVAASMSELSRTDPITERISVETFAPWLGNPKVETFHTLMRRQNGHSYEDDPFKNIFVGWELLHISLMWQWPQQSIQK